MQFSAVASGWALAQPEFGSSVNPITTWGQIMPTTLLLAHPNLNTQRHLCPALLINSQILIKIDVWDFNVPNLTTGEATLLETTQAHEL